MLVYDAFISYSHAEDTPIAAALQSVIQKLGKARYQRRSLRVFLDYTSPDGLTANEYATRSAMDHNVNRANL